MHVESHAESPAARLAVSIYAEVLDAVRADELVRRQVSLEKDTLRIGETPFDLAEFHRVLVVGAGKAATGMAQAIEGVLGDRIEGGVVVTKRGHSGPTERIEVLEAAHPTPDSSSVEAGRRINALAESATERDLVLCLLSGGASSLMELPREPVTLEDLRVTTEFLLRSGAPIQDLNAVRSCLSRIKAGGLARAAAPATVICLVLSDVLGNPLDVIGSGPCVDTPADPDRALDLLSRTDLTSRVPASVLEVLRAPAGVPQRSAARVQHFVLGDIHTALGAARESALRHGQRPLVLTSWLEGEAREVGRVIGAMARDLPVTTRESGFDCLVFGGETTVTVHGQGSGGRSQEIACAALDSVRHAAGVAVLAGSTDGTDGPTDAAGGIAEKAVAERAEELGLEVGAALRNNDCYPFLHAAGGLLRTGPTHSNVGDVVIVVMRDS